jgi:hypothetical protein
VIGYIPVIIKGTSQQYQDAFQGICNICHD